MDSGIVICAYYKTRYVRQLLNSTKEKCAECGVAISIAQSGQVKIEEEGLRPVCVICGVKIMKREGIVQIEPISPEQAVEITKVIDSFIKPKY